VTSAYSFENVYACQGSTTGATTFDNPCDSGTTCGTYAWQCVELSARFLWAIDGIWAGPGSGVQNGADLVSVIGSKYNLPVATSSPSSVPAPGDVISFQSGGNGHTAVVISTPSSNGAFTVMSENDPLNAAGEQSVQVDLSGGHNGKVYDQHLGGWVPANWLAIATSGGSWPLTLGALSGSGGVFEAKSAIGGGWITEQGYIKAIAIASDPTNGVTIGALNTSGVFTAKTGIGGGWVTEDGSIKAMSAGAVSSARVADAPGIGTATRGNSSVSVSFSPSAFDGGSPVTSYTVTATPGGQSATGSTSPITVTGLTNGLGYSFRVVANNGLGTSSPSASSNSVTPATVPGAPTLKAALAANRRIKVTWSSPTSSGGLPIIDYRATAKAAGHASTCSAATSTSCTIAGLKNGTRYTVTVVARNAVGNSQPSDPRTARPHR